MQEKSKTKRVNFTKTTIDAIKPPASDRAYIYDSKQPGLAICTTSTGTKTFYLIRKVDKRPERMRLGLWPGMTIEQARTKAASYKGEIADGHNPNDKRRNARKAPTLGEVFDEFIDLPTRTKKKKPKSEKTKHDYRYQFKTFLEPWRHRLLSTILRPDIERLHNKLGTENGPYMANRVLGLLKTLFNTAIDLWDFGTNPAARLNGFEEEQRDRFIVAEELPPFWKALEEEPSENIRDFVKLALFTGQRRSNVASMKWEDVSLERAVWQMPHTKTGRHAVPLTAAALEILNRRIRTKANEYVIPGRHGHGHLQDPMRQWREILTRAGIENLRIHDLRRSMGSWQTATGSSLSVVGKTLGHSRPETTAIYARLEMTPVRASMETATAAMMAAALPKDEDEKKTTKKPAGKAGKNGKKAK